MNIREMAEAQGLVNFDTAVPIGWTNAQIEQRKLMKQKGLLSVDANEYPFGFVWAYDKSFFGEPFPVTDEAKAWAKEMGIRPRLFDTPDVELVAKND